MNAFKNAVERLRAKTERTIGISELDRGDAQALIVQFDHDGQEIERLKARVAQLEADLERERMRLAACGIVAQANTPESAKAAREMHADYNEERRMEMNDKAKAAIEWLRKLRDDARSVWELNHPTRKQRFLDVSPDDAEALVAHIDGEPARLAAAREEQREACARSVKRVGWSIAATPHANLDAACRGILATPLDATPLADELDEAQRGEREAWRQVDEVRTERDALRARVAELEAWQLTVAEATGYVNRPEGQAGYEVADAHTVAGAIERWRQEAAK